MKIPHYLAAFVLALYLSALNFVLLGYIYEGAASTQNPVFFSFYLSVIVFLLFAALCSLFALKWVFKPFATIFIVITSLSAYFMKSYGVIIDDEMLLSALATDQKEAFSYINLSFILWIIFSIIVPLTLLFWAKISYAKSLKNVLLLNFLGSFALLVLAGLAIFIDSSKITSFARNYPLMKKLNAPFYQIYSGVKVATNSFSKPSILEVLTDDASMKEKRPKLLVFVLGETARAQSYSLLGYTKNDTNYYTRPYVESGNAKYFDFSSCGTATLKSVPCMFAHVGRQEHTSDLFASNAVDFLAKVGVNQLWLGNNTGGCKGVCDRITHFYGKADFDDMLLPLAKQFIEASVKSGEGEYALYLHLLGSHGPTYYKRYPDEFKRFSPTCDTSDLSKCDNEAILNTYDNTVLFTDYILSELMKELSKITNMEASLMYLSDHGESLGENGIYLHGLPYLLAPEYQKRVPFLFFSTNKELVANLNEEKALSQDNIFHSLLGYFKISSKYYDEKLDIFKK